MYIDALDKRIVTSTVVIRYSFWCTRFIYLIEKNYIFQIDDEYCTWGKPFCASNWVKRFVLDAWDRKNVQDKISIDVDVGYPLKN